MSVCTVPTIPVEKNLIPVVNALKWQVRPRGVPAANPPSYFAGFEEGFDAAVVPVTVSVGRRELNVAGRAEKPP